MKQKSILLVIPDHVGFPDVFTKNLEHVGFNVNQLVIPSSDSFKYKSLFQRIQNFLHKTFLKDRDFKRRLFLKQNLNGLSNNLKNISYNDYALLIRPDLFPLELYDKIRSKCKTIVAYQWDGLKRFQGAHQFINTVDRFFVFDSEDLLVENTLPLTNFYFDFSIPQHTPKKNHAFYIGSFLEDRLEEIVQINDKLITLGVITDLRLVTNKKRIIKQLNERGLIHQPDVLLYQENIALVGESDILIDIQNPIHKGLSFRIFEGLGYNKKVITTNENVIDYDFYHPNNILVWKNNNEKELQEFLNKPLIQIDNKIKSKYSFSNWISYVLNHSDYTPISIPKTNITKTLKINEN